MTPSSSIQSFTGMFDSGSSDKGNKLTESVNIPPVASKVSKIRPPTDVRSNTQETKFTSGSTSTSGQGLSIYNLALQSEPNSTSQQSNIQKMVEKIETKRDEMIRDEDAAQDISRNAENFQLNSPTQKSKEVQELNEKIKDLESKLSTLMVKRAEDRQKFKEFERIKIQNEQLLENKKQMAEKIAELSKQKIAAEKEAQEARDEKIRQTEEIRDLIDNSEMAVIDKEMAENRAEQLQIELDQVKLQLDEAKVDFELLKTEIENNGVDGAANSFELKKLEDQNSRYKEALLKLRDISATDRNTIQVMQKDIESKNEEINNLIKSNDKNKTELEKCYEQIEMLKV